MVSLLHAQLSSHFYLCTYHHNILTSLLGEWEGNFGTRNLSDNISDLQAQVAANTRGKVLVDELVCNMCDL